MGTTQKQVRVRGTKAEKSNVDVQVKSRSEGATTLGKKPIIGHEPSNEPKQEDPKVLARQLEFFTHTLTCATSRSARVKALMERKSANGWRTPSGRRNPGWDATKKAKMVRRLMTANQEINQCESAIDQIKHRLEQITEAPKKANDVAPFVPGPATSI